MRLQKNKIRFVIFGLGRSGSTLLKQLLDSHPEITCEGELLNVADKYVTNPLMLKPIFRFPTQFFALRSLLSKNPVYGFTLLFYQYSPPAKLIAKLIKKDWKIIRIYRENSLDQSLSHLVAEKTKMWHRLDNHETETPKLIISPEELKARLTIVNKNKETETTLFENFDHLKVVYEDDLKDKDKWAETSRKVFEYLGVNPAPVSASIQKTYPLPYSEIIENYENLKLLAEKENSYKPR
jgi:LPS sulfotransferase NodH